MKHSKKSNPVFLAMKKHITKEEIKELPRQYFEGDIFVVDQQDQVESAVEHLQQFDALGFDTESRPSFKKGQRNGVALMQVATGQRAFLFRLNKIHLSDSLVDLLEDASIKKIGVALKDDLQSLKKLRDFAPGGFLDLQEYVSYFGIESYSLRKLSAIVLNIKISKRQQLSNWECDNLKDGQLRYAATDAWAPLKIYEKLTHQAKYEIS